MKGYIFIGSKHIVYQYIIGGRLLVCKCRCCNWEMVIDIPAYNGEG